jgi:hypothetical protein
MKLFSKFKWLWAIGLVLLLILGCFGLVLLSSYFAGYVVRGTRPIPGDASKFDAFASLPQIQQFAGDNEQLLRIDMEYVKPDGTLDLTANYGAQVDYQFAHVLDATPSNAAPLGAGGSAPGGTFAQRVTVMLAKPGASGTAHDQYYNFGMVRNNIPAAALTQTIAPAPSCALRQLWESAIKQDAPANAVAIMSYDNTGYTFSIDAAHVHLTFDPNCQLVP